MAYIFAICKKRARKSIGLNTSPFFCHSVAPRRVLHATWLHNCLLSVQSVPELCVSAYVILSADFRSLRLFQLSISNYYPSSAIFLFILSSWRDYL